MDIVPIYLFVTWGWFYETRMVAYDEQGGQLHKIIDYSMVERRILRLL